MNKTIISICGSPGFGKTLLVKTLAEQLGMEQPIFYPVLNFEYAEQIARDWNATTPPYAGFVTRF